MRPWNLRENLDSEASEVPDLWAAPVSSRYIRAVPRWGLSSPWGHWDKGRRAQQGYIQGTPNLHWQLWTQKPPQSLQVKSCGVGHKKGGEAQQRREESKGNGRVGDGRREKRRREEIKVSRKSTLLYFTFIFSSWFSTCATSNCLCFSRSLSMEASCVCCRFLICSLMLLFSKVTSTRVFCQDDNKNQI